MFAGFAVLRGAELAATENDNFGIDHPTVGALWSETIGFPQPVVDTIRKSAPAAAPTATGRSTSPCAAPASWPPPWRRSNAVDVAWAACRPSVQVRFGGARPSPTPPSAKLYDALQETEPTF